MPNLRKEMACVLKKRPEERKPCTWSARIDRAFLFCVASKWPINGNGEGRKGRRSARTGQGIYGDIETVESV